ncbi:tellurite resistance TerB family protein [Caulobacter segnis]|uniref:Tellurite resistance TerB n=2 Tax=Caulobacter segnis TaxID=88688 RepID=D5VPG8_CAUST|nr:TerB family tellurite resistance protein [Caulobacter segnis]ADG12391.1 Tellurite resistance TerB [Caulobacter segnis ATCC 21756]
MAKPVNDNESQETTMNNAVRKALGPTDVWTPRQLEQLDAVVAACMLIAQADGEVSTEERGRMLDRIRGQAGLIPFGVDDVLEAFEALDARFESRPEEARAEAEMMIRQLKGRAEAVEVAAAALAVSIADGGLEAQEREVILDICAWLGVSSKRFDLAH